MPQPIDIPSELGRVTAAERIAQIADRASVAAQARVDEEAGVQRQRSETQTQQADQKNEEVDDELRRRTPYVGRRAKKKDGEPEDGKHGHGAADRPVIPDDSGPHGLDISI